MRAPRSWRYRRQGSGSRACRAIIRARGGGHEPTPDGGRAAAEASRGLSGSMRLGSGHRGADDARVVAELRRDDPGPDRQPRYELLRLLADSAAQDDEVRREQLVDGVEMLVQVACPGLPREAATGPGGGRRSALGVA